MWTRNLCFGELWDSILFPARRPALGAKEHEPCSKFQEGSCLACTGAFPWELLHSVACTRLVERAKRRTLFFVTELCIFLPNKNWRSYRFGLFSLLVIDVHTWLSIENVAGWRKDSTSCFCLVLSPLKTTNCVSCFLSWEAVLSLLLSLAISEARYPFNSAALPVFWQLNLPCFLVITSLLSSLNTYSQGTVWSAVLQEAPI